MSSSAANFEAVVASMIRRVDLDLGRSACRRTSSGAQRCERQDWSPNSLRMAIASIDLDRKVSWSNIFDALIAALNARAATLDGCVTAISQRARQPVARPAAGRDQAKVGFGASGSMS